MQAQEADLQARWGAVSTLQQPARQQLLQETVALLQPLEHWWCEHPALAQALTRLLKRHDGSGSVQQLWTRMAGQLGACTNCVVAFHAALVQP